jgi:hypothetical protein
MKGALAKKHFLIPQSGAFLLWMRFFDYLSIMKFSVIGKDFVCFR